LPSGEGETKGKFTHFSFDELNLILVMDEECTRVSAVRVD
jgi:hypothetical protein